MVPFKKVNLGTSYAWLKPFMDNGMIGLGEAVFEFEEKLAKYVGAKYCVALSSCTAALLLSLIWEKNRGVKGVSIPSMTVPHTANAVLQAGLELRLDGRTDWVGGRYLINGSKVVDSAHELRRDVFKYFPDDIKVCYSFYPTKTIGSADGGAVCTNDKEFVDWLRSVSSYGRDQKASQSSSWNYDIINLGYKCNWNNLQAVIALEQLSRLDETNKRRAEIAAIYNKMIPDYVQVIQNSDYLYRIKVNRDNYIKFMMDHGVECGVHFKPLHLMTPFKDLKVEYPAKIEQVYAQTV